MSMTSNPTPVSSPAPSRPISPISQPARSRARRRARVLAEDDQADLSPVLVGVYIRVSLAREEMISPELQQRDVNQYMARMTAQTGRPWRAAAVEQDLDVSGRSFARRGIQRLMDLMRQGEITTILTYRYDRFGRNLKQALTHLEEVEALGGQVVSVTEPMDATTAVGHYMRSNTLALAEMQSRTIGEGWKRVHQYRIDRGLPTNGRERYGYLAHRTTQQRGDGAWRMCPQGCAVGECQTGFVPDPETALIVQRIYAAYVGGKGFQAVAHALNAEAISSPGVIAARRSGNTVRIARTATTTWVAGSVIDVCDSGFAAGLITHNGRWHPGAHDALITQEQWAAYQQRREAQRIIPTKARSPKWSLAGIAVCGSCGGPMYCTSSPRGDQYALYCGNARVSGACKGSYRTRAAVEAAVSHWLQQYAVELERATQAALHEQPRQPKIDTSLATRRRLDRLIQHTEVKLARLLDVHLDGGVDLAEYRRRRDALRHEIDQAQARLYELDAPQVAEPSPEIVGGFAEVWPTLSVEARRDVAAALLVVVHVNPDKTVAITPKWGQQVLIRFSQRNAVPRPPG